MSDDKGNTKLPRRRKNPYRHLYPAIGLPPTEVAKLIPNYPHYAIDFEGNIWRWSFPNEFPKHPKGQWVIMGWHLNKEGYKRVYLKGPGPDAGRTKLYYVHHLVLRTFHGPKPLGHDAKFDDGNRQNCAPKNLKWGKNRRRAKVVKDPMLSKEEEREWALKRTAIVRGQIAKAVSRGLVTRVYEPRKRKLTPEDIQQIRYKYKHTEGSSFSKLAREYDVTPGTICHIVHYKTWADVPDLSPPTQPEEDYDPYLHNPFEDEDDSMPL